LDRNEVGALLVAAGLGTAAEHPLIGLQLPRIVITNAVQDVERWLGGKAERAPAFTGITNVTDLVAMDGSNHAGVAFDA
jgi:hypothetical protein